jgi:hypothetical protein
LAIIASWREEAAEVLLEADAGFFRDAGGVGIEGLEKAVDFLLDLLIARCNGLPWLDLAVHFPLHPYLSPEQLSWASKEAETRTFVVNT